MQPEQTQPSVSLHVFLLDLFLDISKCSHTHTHRYTPQHTCIYKPSVLTLKLDINRDLIIFYIYLCDNLAPLIDLIS